MRGGNKNSSAGSSPYTVPSKIKVEQPREKRECFYCHKVGHVIVDCGMLRKKQQNSSGVQSVGLIKTLSIPTDAVYEPFMFEGFVSFSGQPGDQIGMRVLRDTGAARSVIRGDVLPFSEDSYLGSSILVQGISIEVVKVPLHRVHLQTELITGFVDVGVRPALPVPGVEFILGNDLAGGRVLPVLEVLDRPVITSVTEELTREYPEAFPACVLSRAQTRKMGTEFTLDDTFMCTDDVVSSAGKCRSQEAGNEKVSSFLPPSLPASRDKLVKSQQSDVTLIKCFDAVSSSEGNTLYFLEDGLLMRKWKPRVVDNEECSTVWQIVVPTEYRSYVLSLAHDHVMSGHLGVAKMYNCVLQHFFLA